MKLYTKDYVKFKILDDLGEPIKEIEGIEHVNRCLPGDEINIDGTLLKRANHPMLVGIIHFASKIKYGITSKGTPIYLFEPINKAYPIMIAGSTERGATTNMIGIARFESWDKDAKYPRASLIRIIGQCGEEKYEKEALIHRYSPWPYPKEFTLSPNYLNELKTRELLEGFTFNIDPPGCEDVDDVVTLKKLSETEWILTINITDVASGIEENSVLDLYSQKLGQSLYPNGQAPKHMLPPAIGIKELSLLPGVERNCISLSVNWSLNDGITDTKWILSKVKVDRAYTYNEAYNDTGAYMPLLSNIVKSMAGKAVITSEEWVETLMVYYNKEAGRLLKSHNTGILRNHSEPDKERLKQWTLINPALEKLAYSSAEYVPANTIGRHWGLDLNEYAHASSPLRRYADLHNQRCLLRILKGEIVPPLVPLLCKELNILQKDSKAFERDMFFLEALSNTRAKIVEATLLEIQDGKHTLHFWVPIWNRIIRVKSTVTIESGLTKVIQKDAGKSFDITIGKKYRLEYYIHYQNAQWKDRILFNVYPLHK
jgi:exoribonuclease R